jgi:hypothetical protein
VFRHRSERREGKNRTDRKRISEGEAKVTRAVPMRLSTFGAARRGASKASRAGLVPRCQGHGGDAGNAKPTAPLLIVGETAL